MKTPPVLTLTLTPPELADRLCRSRTTIYNMVEDGAITQPHQIGCGRLPRFFLEDIEPDAYRALFGTNEALYSYLTAEEVAHELRICETTLHNIRGRDPKFPEVEDFGGSSRKLVWRLDKLIVYLRQTPKGIWIPHSAKRHRSD